MRASFEPSTIDEKKRTVDVVWTTGAPVLRGYYDSYYEELSLDPKHVRMGRLQSGAAPLLNAHGSYDITDVLGVVESARLEKGKGTATVRFDSGPQGEDAFRRVREGTLRNISVGYTTYKMQKVEDGAATIPRYMAVDWEPAELSLVPIPADAGATTRSGATTTPCEFVEERAMPDPVPPTPTNPAPVVTPTPPTPVTASPEVRAAAEQDERERILGIQRAGRALKRPQAEVDDAIVKGMKLDAFRAAAIDALANAPADQGGPLVIDKRDGRISAGADERDKFVKRSEDWLVVRTGVAPMLHAAAQKLGQKVDIDPGASRGVTLVEMARECLERAGVDTRGMDKDKIVGVAFTHRSGAANSTSDFPIILENVMHKTLLGSYMTTPDTWRRFCVTGTVTDFRAHNRYRQGSFGVFDTMVEGGEYKAASIPDGEKQTITATTKGRILAITRAAIINDDMGALTDIATRLGRAAALTIEVDVYAQFALNAGAGPTMSDGLALFHATHKNIGAPLAISVASIEADRVLMAQQQDPNKQEYLELRPSILVLPVGIGGQARVINQAQYDVDAKANARMMEPNKVVGLYRDIVDTARLTGTTRYSFADPGIAPVFEVAFLNGQEQPYLEMQQGWRVDGVEYKARLDYGIGARDWRGVVQNAGA